MKTIKVDSKQWDDKIPGEIYKGLLIWDKDMFLNLENNEDWQYTFDLVRNTFLNKMIVGLFIKYYKLTNWIRYQLLKQNTK